MNTDNYTIRDRLHALADGQLDAEQSREILALLEQDSELQKALCEIQRIKHLVQSAYPLPDGQPDYHGSLGRQVIGKMAAVYLLAFVLTFTAGFASHYAVGLFHPQVEGVTLADAPRYDDRFIVFVDSNEPDKLESALLKAENLAGQVASSGGSVHVVTSAEGIDLLRLGTTRYEQRIAKLNRTYPALHFVACNSTLYLFQQRGELVALVDEAEVASSTVEFVVRHLQQGWRYVAI